MPLHFVVLACLLAIGCNQNVAATPNGPGLTDGGSSVDLTGSDLAGAASVDLAGPDFALPPGAHDYGHDGPEAVTEQTETVSGPSGSFQVVVYLPGSAGTHPVVILSSGLLQPAAGYASYGHRLASWGMVAIERDDPGFTTQSSAIAGDVTYLATSWLSSGPLAGMVDPARIGLAGHSRGGQVALLAAEGGLKGKVKGVFGLDPVDGSQGGTTASGSLGSIGIPTTFIGELTDSTGGTLGMACAPADSNFQVLYAAAPSPSVEITAVNADHTQLEDAAGCMYCGACTAGTADGATVLAYSVKYLTAFFARELLGDAAVGAAFAGAGAAADLTAGRIQLTSK
ncbi:MAG TPA: hypothetical protein VII38_12555 [Polyangia bacterium]